MDLVGKTIKTVDNSAVNYLILGFTDGTYAGLETEAVGDGLYGITVSEHKLNFMDRIRQYQLENKRKDDFMAFLMGVSRHTLQRWKNGTQKPKEKTVSGVLRRMRWTS